MDHRFNQCLGVWPRDKGRSGAFKSKAIEFGFTKQMLKRNALASLRHKGSIGFYLVGLQRSVQGQIRSFAAQHVDEHPFGVNPGAGDACTGKQVLGPGQDTGDIHGWKTGKKWEV
jgi:hypothetical protein